MSTSIILLSSDVDDPFVSRFFILEILILVDIIVEWLSEKIVHSLIKVPNWVHLLNSYYFILDMVPLKLPIVS